VTDSAPKQRSRWPLAVGAVVVLGAGITLWRATASEQPEQAKTFGHVYVPMLSSLAAPPSLPKCGDGMVLIDRATFAMGGDGTEESPIHKLTLGPFCIDKTEVSAKQYRACVAAGKCEEHKDALWQGIEDDDKKRHNPNCTLGLSDREDHPVNCVSWTDADAYCAWAGKRLPSEPEWELAARGAEGRVRPWGDAAPDATHVNVCDLKCREIFWHGSTDSEVMFDGDDGFGATAPVGHYPGGASPYGVLDMAGNVGEWTADWFTPYEGSLTPVEDPKAPAEPAENPRRVARGGSFLTYDANKIISTNRAPWSVDRRMATLGFRCASGVK
jgi:formylglycine-generating enzyme required for sulfatase activity